jgi:hypothetical protein
VQEEVYSGYKWPALQTSAVVDVAANSRYSAYPTGLSFQGIREVYAKAPTKDWHELGHSIGPEHLNRYDSDAGETAADVAAWQNYVSPDAEVVNQNMFEVWPIPDQATKIRFHGRRALAPLSNPDTDWSTVDGPIVVLHAAAELLAGQRSEDAALKLNKAQARYELLRREQNSVDNRKVNMARKNSRTGARQGIVYIK